MANQLANRTWIIDTAGSGMVTTDPVYVKSIHWNDKAGSAGDEVLILDANDKTLFDSTESGANYRESVLIERWWYNGFKVTTLGGGVIRIEMA